MTSFLFLSRCVSSQDCPVCNNSNDTVGSPDKPFPIPQLADTCGGLEERLAGLGAFCNSTRDVISFIDIAGFCDCPNTVSPQACQICLPGQRIVNTSDLEAFVPQLNVSLSCSDAQSFVEFVVDDGICVAMGLLFSNCCEPVPSAPSTSPPQVCSICRAADATINFTDRVLPLTSLADNCGELDTLLTTIGGENCAAFTQTLEYFNYPAYCGCTYATNPNVCSICTEGKVVVDMDKEISSENFSPPITCGEAFLAMQYITDESVCDGLNLFLDQECCGIERLTPSPVPGPTISEPSSGTVGGGSIICSLCGDSILTAPSRRIAMSNGAAGTCAEYDNELSQVDISTCSLVIVEYPFLDIRAFCGCEGTRAPNMCPVCVNKTVLDESKEIGASGVTLTCEEAKFLSQYLTDPNLCPQLSALFEATCCPATGGTGSPGGDGNNLTSANATSSGWRIGGMVVSCISMLALMLWI